MSIPEFRILCSVSIGPYEPWLDIFRNGQEATWLSGDWPPEVEVVHFHANPVGKFLRGLDDLHEGIRWSGVKRAALLRFVDRIFSKPFLNYVPKATGSQLLSPKSQGKSIHFHFPDTYVTYRWKELALFAYFLEQNEFDYLFITSAASYVRLNALVKFVNNLSRSGIYSGAHPYPEANFVSGACRILSKDVVAAVYRERMKFDPAVIEDLALGDLIRSLGYEPIYITANNISSLATLNEWTDKDLLSRFHFRLKSGSLEDRNDVRIMKALHERLKRLGD
jgi:hypothetical protein